MAKKSEKVSIAAIQGPGYLSPLAKRRVLTQGIVTASSRRGFFLQDPEGKPDPHTSCGIFVLSRKHRPKPGSRYQVEGIALDYLPSEFDRPVTEIKATSVELLEKGSPPIEPVWLTAANMPNTSTELALFLNAHEGMLAGINAGAVFIAPSNPFADYVVVPHDVDETLLRSEHGGVLIDATEPDRWYPSFKVVDYDQAFAVNVGAELESDVVGALNYRSAAWQLAVNHAVRTKPGPRIDETVTSLTSCENAFTVMTLNTLNLDVKIESKDKVADPRRDIDDDLGDGRFERLAAAVVTQAKSPDIVALQEIQDNDGAEITEVVDASETYGELIKAIQRLGGPDYHWVDIAPKVGADGGQPGGNIRNGFLYNPLSVEPLPKTLRLIGAENSAFEESRKPLTVTFRRLDNQQSELTLINVHLASKRHQRGVFSPQKPGFDPKLEMRVEQASIIREVLLKLGELGRDYLVTGDFNDHEFSPTLKALLGSESRNLVDLLEPAQRYDYNHRGKLQVLMHGLVSEQQFKQDRVEYEILHGNELMGIQPGDGGGKASDHAYTIARLKGQGNE